MSASFFAAIRGAIEDAVTVSSETIAEILEDAAREQRRIAAWADPLRITHAQPNVTAGWDVTTHDGSGHVVSGELMSEAVGTLSPRALVGRHYLWRDDKSNVAVSVIGTVQDSIASDDADQQRQQPATEEPPPPAPPAPVASGGTEPGEKIVVSGAAVGSAGEAGDDMTGMSGTSTISGASSGFETVAAANGEALSGLSISGATLSGTAVLGEPGAPAAEPAISGGNTSGGQ